MKVREAAAEVISLPGWLQVRCRTMMGSVSLFAQVRCAREMESLLRALGLRAVVIGSRWDGELNFGVASFSFVDGCDGWRLWLAALA